MADRVRLIAAFVSAGSNIEPRQHLDAAITMLLEQLDVLAVSTVYRTPAIGRPNDPAFLNCVFRVRTSLSPHAVKFNVLRTIEAKLGRRHSLDSYAPRTIDLDLVLYGDLILDEPDLKLPHPDLSRWFVRVPLLELSPQVEVPGCGRLRDISPVAGESEGVQPVFDFTEQLRRRLCQ